LFSADKLEKVRIHFRLNGRDVSALVLPRQHLVDLLRQEFRLTGSHLGCEHGVCGACNVLLDGAVVRGCLTLGIQAHNAEVVTIEGMTATNEIRDLQDTFVRRNALQCGFCTSGMLMSANELLADEGSPSRAEIRCAISGNYCRCTGYHAIVDAIESVALQRMRAKSSNPPVPGEAKPIAKSASRANAVRASEGRGTYTDDIVLPNMASVAFLRSPHAHARITAINVTPARAAHGVIAVFTGTDLASVSMPWQTRLALMPTHRSMPQPPLAVDEACWQGEAVAAVVANTRAEAEDALELIEVDWEQLPAVADLEHALDGNLATVHTLMADNLALDQSISAGDSAANFAQAKVVVEHSFRFERQTAVSLEPRCIVSSFDRNLGELTIYQSHQAPFQMREVFSEQLGMKPEKVRVIVKDVGGGFGMKLHAFADEMAVVAISLLLPIPVKFTADRLESFISDSHTRDASVHARMALGDDANILGIEVDILAGFGAYSIYPRGSVGEVMQTLQMVGAPYDVASYKGRARGVLQNKPPTGAYRGVGQPLACTITEQLMDLAAAAADVDPAELRRRNYRKTSSELSKTSNGIITEELSLTACLDALLERMNYRALREEQTELRRLGIFRGIGISTFVEMTGVGSALYGRQGLRVSANESCRLTLEANGRVVCETSITDQGQGTSTGIGQIVAEELGVTVDSVDVITGDTAITPYGGGAWASRGIAIGGEAARQAASELRENALEIAASLLQQGADTFSIVNGAIVNSLGVEQLTLAEIAGAARYRQYSIPLERIPTLEVVTSYVPKSVPYLVANGVQAASVEVDVGTGIIKLLNFWVVDDCGRVINPLLVDEQLRGGAVQGIGAALYEVCEYSAEGQILNGNLADYLVPMASEMPDIDIAHISTLTRSTELGSKGVGEAGTIGAPGALWTAVNDALRPLGVQVTRQPFDTQQIVEMLKDRRQN